MNILSIYQRFKTQKDCIKHLETIRWPNGVKCTYCGSVNISEMPDEDRHHCNGCNTSFSVTVGTIFHHTHLPLQVWFLAISLILNAKKGLSARQLARDLQINKNTAWRISMKIRDAMKYDGELLSGIVEVDETFIGGKPRKPNKHKGRSGKKQEKNPVIGAVSRDGHVVTETLNKRATLNTERLNTFIKGNIDLNDSIVLTDQYGGYSSVSTFLQHLTVNHSRCYVEDNGVNINTIESFWAIVKRGIVGQYHKVSEYYLHKYLNEFSFRYNHRKVKQELIFEKVLKRGVLTA